MKIVSRPLTPFFYLLHVIVPQYGSMEIHARNLHIVYKAGRNLRLCDGVLFSNCPEFEPDAAAMLQKELDKPVFQIGCVSFLDRVCEKLCNGLTHVLAVLNSLSIGGRLHQLIKSMDTNRFLPIKN